jgi:hypothetical protein
VFGGIHFRTACDDGQATGAAVAEFVSAGVKIALDNQRPCAHWQASFRMVGKPHLTLLELEPDIVLDRTATAAPHAFGVDDILRTRWQYNVPLSGSIPSHGVAA